MLQRSDMDQCMSDFATALRSDLLISLSDTHPNTHSNTRTHSDLHCGVTGGDRGRTHEIYYESVLRGPSILGTQT